MATINLTNEELILVISAVRNRIKQLALIDIDHDEELRRIQREEIKQMTFVRNRLEELTKGELIGFRNRLTGSKPKG